MPALNINFTEDEIGQLRERARGEGVSLRTLAHDTIVNCTRREREQELIREAYQHAKSVSAGLLVRLAAR